VREREREKREREVRRIASAQIKKLGYKTRSNDSIKQKSEK
jgi:hypothetical protein